MRQTNRTIFLVLSGLMWVMAGIQALGFGATNWSFVTAFILFGIAALVFALI